MNKQQSGYFLVVAVIFVLIIATMGSLIAYLFSNRAQLSVAMQNGLKTFYIAESGLEIGARVLTMPGLTGTPSRFACSTITGHAQLTNAAMGSGTFTLTAANNVATYATNTLSAAITNATDTTVNVSSSSGFASSGRILVDREAMDYTAVSGSAFLNVTRGVAGTLASTHASGAGVGQYQCSLDGSAGIPNVASPKYQRELQWNIALQDGWAVGNVSGSNFVLSHWNEPTELTWTALKLASGSNAMNLNGVSLLSYADGWAVGDAVSNHLTFLHWTGGSSWALVTVAGACNSQDLTGVSMVSSKEGWAVGVSYHPGCSGSTYRYDMVYWNGSSWSLLTPSTAITIPADTSTNQTFNAVHVIDTDGDGKGNVGFAVGTNGFIFQYNGSTWTKLTSPTTKGLNGVYTVSANEAWAVGASGVILKWNGSSWSTVTSPVTTALNAIAMLDTNGDGVADIGWAVGDSSKILTYNGSTWSSADFGGNNLYGVAIVNTNDAWAVGANGTAFHYDGSTWTSIDPHVTQRLNAVSLIPSNQTPVSGWRQVFR